MPRSLTLRAFWSSLAHPLPPQRKVVSVTAMRLRRRLAAGLSVAMSLVAVTGAAASPSGIVISELQPAAPEFIEFVNAGNTPVTIPTSGCIAVNSPGNPIPGLAFCFTGGQTIAPGQHYLIADGSVASVAPDAGAGTLGIQKFPDTDGGVALREVPGAVNFDAVGYGTTFAGQLVEGSPTANPQATDSLRRKNAGTRDTDANLQDFEIATTPTPQNSTTIDDLDGDGRVGLGDNCGAVANPAQVNSDSDVLGDACDGDDDDDGVGDGADNCSTVGNADQRNTDRDPLGNACDADDDGDTVADAADNCSLTVNAGQLDLDADGLGDACDPDQDNDGTANDVDNCRAVANRGQVDNDADGAGDACDGDDDGDGRPDSSDRCRLTAGTAADGCPPVLPTPGMDLIVGTLGRDAILGLGGDDWIFGLDGRDVLRGGPGNDRVDGGDGRDAVSGDAGKDRLTGGAGRDRIAGGSGRDRVLATDGERDVIDCGSGRDRVSADRKDRLRRCERVLRRAALR